MPKLTLYMKPGCPYCRKVLDFMTQNAIFMHQKDISQNPQHRQELISIGGKPQVPCLIIDGKAMYESDDIIEWLKKHQKS